MQQPVNKFKQTNAYAMQYGIFLGIWGILSLVIMGLSLKVTALSLLSTLTMLFSPVIATFLTIKFRKNILIENEGFTFGRGFIFTFIMGIYASIWIAAFVFIYLAYLDNGAIFNAYESLFNSPQYANELEQSGVLQSINATSISDMIDAMRSISPANYAGMILYISFMTSPIFSAIIALVCRKSIKFEDMK